MNLKFGIVEDVLDPLEAGRIRVRVFGVHTANKTVLPTEGLPWAQAAAGCFDGTFSGVGKSPTGVMLGQMMIVVFLDEHYQMPLILGTIAGMNTEVAMILLGSQVSRDSEEYGFTQKLLDEAYLNQPDTNIQARNNTEEYVHPVHTARVESTEMEITTDGGGSWNEPESTMNMSTYPNSKVTETEQGHLFEVDDTPENERILTYHKSGSFTEMTNSAVVYKSVGDKFDMTAGASNQHVIMDKNITVDANYNIDNAGTFTHNSVGDFTLKAPNLNIGVESSESAVLGEKLATWIETELLPWLNTHTHIGNLGSPTSPAVSGFQAGTGANGGAVYSKTVLIQA